MTADKEKRRAISREAARRRRRVESDVFGDLSRLLPLHPSIQSHLDKPTVIRLTLSYIRMHTVLKGNAGIKTEASHAIKYGPAIEGAENKTDLEKRKQNGGQEEKEREVEKREVEKREAEKREVEEREAEYREMEETSMYLKILEGFLMVVSTEGDMMYLSGNVNKYMGLTQTELMGHNIFDFTHPCDHEEIRNNLRLTAEEVWRGAKRDFVMRIKSALTHRGRSANLKSATWKVLHCQGRAKMCIPQSSGACLLLTCQPLPLSHTLLSTHTFTSQHSMDMRFTHCDQRVTVLLGYTAEELVGRSIYNLCHAQDINRLRKNHLNLCWKSQSVSGQYRMLVKGGGYVWVESHSAVIPSVRPSKSRPGAHQPLCILCVTYVLSGVEQASLQLSLDQTGHRYLS